MSHMDWVLIIHPPMNVTWPVLQYMYVHISHYTCIGLCVGIYLIKNKLLVVMLHEYLLLIVIFCLLFMFKCQKLPTMSGNFFTHGYSVAFNRMGHVPGNCVIWWLQCAPVYYVAHLDVIFQCSRVIVLYTLHQYMSTGVHVGHVLCKTLFLTCLWFCTI